MRPWTVLCAVLVGCVEAGNAENPNKWFDDGSTLSVEEPIAFTDVPYDFTGETPIAELPDPPAFTTLFAADDAPGNQNCLGWSTTEDLPKQIMGIVTTLPRFYYKTSGCTPDQTVDSDQKFYGSYFIQDRSGGYFVLGDSKVAHFDMGDRVTMDVRAVRNSFDQQMISVHDVVVADRGPEPIYYRTATAALGFSDIAEVVRIEGVVGTEATTFGEVYIDADNGVRYKMGLDIELNRRGVYYPPGTRLQITGPVLYSFSEFTIIIMRLGQIEER